MNSEQIKQKLDTLILLSNANRTIDKEDIESYGEELKLGGMAIQLTHTKGIMLIFETKNINDFKTIEL
jgi:uncharacterized protein YlzI (FlbEa/FlbD family)